MTQADTPTGPEPTAPTPTPATEAPAPPPATPAAPVYETSPKEESGKPPRDGNFWGTGRRKSAVARVRIRAGKGQILVNKRELNKYFHEPQEVNAVREPLIATSTERQFDVFINVRGGGHAGQAGAVRLGVARALVEADKKYEPALRDKEYLTRDSRVVERKKYGRRKARRRFQFSKR